MNKNKRKDFWRNFIANIIIGIIVFGFLIIFGSVGAMEVGNITIKQGIIQCVVGFLVIGVGGLLGTL